MGQQYNLLKIQKKLKKELDDDRYRHTLGVMYTAASLSMRYAPQKLEETQVAGLLHDCAKCIPNDKKLRLCERYNLPVTEIERSAPSLLHAKLGAYLAKERYHIQDEEILGGIRWHTTGKDNMTLMEKIIFLADYIEPGRWKAQHLDAIRQMAFTDLDRAVYLTLHDTLNYLRRGPGLIDEMTQRAHDYYEALIQNDKDMAIFPVTETVNEQKGDKNG